MTRVVATCVVATCMVVSRLVATFAVASTAFNRIAPVAHSLSVEVDTDFEARAKGGVGARSVPASLLGLSIEKIQTLL